MKRLIRYFSVLAVLAALALPAQVWPLASFMPHPNPQYFNGGVPCANCRLYFYENNTTTLKATYTDASGTVQNANPVILNSKGEATSGIWLNGIYSVKLVTSLGATVWGPKNDIAGLADASLTGATLSQWQASGKVPTYINTTTFSTVGDNTSMFQAGRRLEITTSGGIRYGRIASSSYGAGVTQTVMELDSGTLDSGISQVNISLVTPTNRSLSYDMIASGQNSSNLSTSGVHTNSGTFVSSGSFTSTGSAAFSGTTSMTGTTNITGPTSISSATTSGTWTQNVSTGGTYTVTDGGVRFAVAAGTAPFSIPTTTTMVTGLNAQYLGGFLPSQTPGANQVIVKDSNARAYIPYIYMATSDAWSASGVAGVFEARTSATDAPDGSTDWGLHIPHAGSTLYWTQIASRNGKLWFRTNENGTIGAWHTVWHSGNDGPYFEAYKITSNQTINSATGAIVTFTSENADSHSAFASSKFTVPTGGDGRYRFEGAVYSTTAMTTNNGWWEVYLYKNGAGVKNITRNMPSSINLGSLPFVFEADGVATDYFEIYVVNQTGGNIAILYNSAANLHTWFAGHRIK